MARRTLALFAIALLAIATPSSLADPKPGDGTTPLAAFSLAEQKVMTSVAGAYMRGEAGAALEVLSPVLAKWDDSKVAMADALFEENGLPRLARQLAEARLAELKLNPQGRGSKLSGRESLLILPELGADLDKALAAARSHRWLNRELPHADGLEAYEQLFWEAHVLENQLEQAATISAWLQNLVERVPRREKSQLDETQREFAKRDYRLTSNEIAALKRELAERQVELRADRLAKAKGLLENPLLSKEKFLAAFTWQLDAGLLEEAYRASVSPKTRRDDEKAQKFVRARLNEPDFFKNVAEDAKAARQSAGDLTAKANLLYKGLHWWYRGRYGMGPFVFGLAKHPDAIHSEEGQLGLYMPMETAKPNDPGKRSESETPQPYLDRRHHYWWAWEDRRIARSGFERARQTTTEEWVSGTQQLKLPFFW